MRVAFECMDLLQLLVPGYALIVMSFQPASTMYLEHDDLLVCVVIEDAKLEVVRATHEPILAHDEAHAAYGVLCNLKQLHKRPSFMIVDVDATVVDACEQPRQARLETESEDASRGPALACVRRYTARVERVTPRLIAVQGWRRAAVGVRECGLPTCGHSR